MSRSFLAELKTRQIRIAVTWAAQFQLFAAAVPRHSIPQLFSMCASAAARRCWLRTTWPMFVNRGRRPTWLWRQLPCGATTRYYRRIDRTYQPEGRLHPIASRAAPGGTLGVHDLWVKDEGLNPTASFKARGMSAAVSMAKKLGIARWRSLRPATRRAPWRHTPRRPESKLTSSCRRRSAIELHRVQGVRRARHAGERTDQRLRPDGRRAQGAEGWFDVSTLKEPYRIEGKKTMGYEVAEQFGGNCPM